MTLSASATAKPALRLGEAGAALVATLAFVALQAANGFAALTNAAGDNDSLLRLVEVRDLLAGQGWFDLHQYRMGPEGGFVMHWSRLVDAPIAGVVLLGSALSGGAAWGEAAALVLWPALLFFAALFFLLRATRALGGADTMLPALLIGATALNYTGLFLPGALDHHNLQLVLTLATLSFLLDASARDAARSGALAGACTALSLAIAMEAAPYVAVAGIIVALWFLAEPLRTRLTAMGFGLAFGGLSAVLFLVTVPLGAWFAAQCDAFSLPQLSAAALAGFGLAAVVSMPALGASVARRAVALLSLGALLAVALAVFFPQCLADPYAGLDPRIKSWWLDAVTEAQPLWKIVALDPAMAAAHYITPLIGLVWLAFAVRRSGLRRDLALVAAFLAAAFLVSIWQVRGAMFSIPLAVIPLSAFVAGWRLYAARQAGTPATLKMAGAWLLSFNVVWAGAANALAGLSAPGNPAAGGIKQAAVQDCQAEADFARLAAMPATGVLVVSNLGSPVLRWTPHRVLAGPYHRNVAGNLAAIDAFTGPTTAAREIAARHHVTLVGLCRGNDESRVFAERAPAGLLAMLERGDVPDWLLPVAETAGQPLELFRVVARD